jgi:putative ABC transport system permease protein
MRRIAIRSLTHDRSKLVAAICGVAFAGLLVFLQTGLYAGFLDTSSSMISRMGGDVWVMPRGTEVMDSVETLSAGSRAFAEAQPCVARVRPLVFTWGFVRKTGGTRDNVRVVGVERAAPGAPIVPWTLAEGLPSDIRPPMRVAVDAFDLGKLQIDGEPVGRKIEIGGETAEIAAVSKGVRSFTLLPFVFADIGDARRMTGMSDGQANYWVLDLADPSCAPDVIRGIEKNPELAAVPTDVWLARTQAYWIGGSGVGAVLSFTALLGLIVGLVVVGQTLYTMTKEHHRELATLKALGATSAELVGFVGWQAALLAAAGGALGLVLAALIARAAAGAGLEIILAPWVVVTGLVTIVVMCAAASLLSVRRILSLSPNEVFS